MHARTYKAAIFKGAGDVVLAELPYPQCGDDEIIVKNLLAGVCGSDVSAYKRGGDAHMIWKDHEFGHEVVSEVVEMGRNVRGLALGDHVFPNLGNARRDRKRMATVGGFSEYIRIPQCEAGYSVLKIDNAIPLECAVLLEPFVVGARGARNLRPGPDKTAIVFGAGIIGMAAAIMLKWYGCPKVMIVDVSDFRLDNAKKFDLITCNPGKEDLTARAFAEFGTRNDFVGERCKADIYLDAIGVKAAIDYFAMLAGREATLAIVGAHREPVAWNLRHLSLMNWHVTGCGNVAIEELSVDILRMMRSGKYDLASLITHEYPVDKIADALVMGGKAGEAQKVCVRFA